MKTDIVEKGCIVSLEYTGKLDNGEVFDTSKHGDHSHPLEFEVGCGQVIKGFDDAVLGLKVGEKKSFRIKKEEAYGERNEDLIKSFPIDSFPKEMVGKMKVGMTIALGTPEGMRVPAQIIEIKKESIKLDLNHPMAGKDLNFEIEIVSIEKVPPSK